MPRVKDILAVKGSQVHMVDASTTVLGATQQMNQHKIGAVIVTEGDGEARVAGIFTERDVLRRVVAEQRDPAQTRIGEVMTRDVICVPPEADLDEVASLMKHRRIRHLPVCERHGRLLGMISIGDVNALYSTAQEAQIHFLNDYIYGRV